MSRFETGFSTLGIPSLMHDLGATASYAAPTGSSQGNVASLFVLLSDQQETMNESDGGEVLDASATIACAADATGIVTAERLGAFTIGTAVWRILEPPVSAAGLWSCRVGRMRAARYNERRSAGHGGT